MRDPRLGYLTVTGVDMTKDLKVAKVFISVMGSDTDQANTLEALEGATPFIRRELADRVRLRHTPELTFAYDDSIERGSRINRLLDSL